MQKFLVVSFPILVLLFSTLAKGGTDHFSPNGEIARTITSYYLDNGKINEAIAYLKDRIQADPQDPDLPQLLDLVEKREFARIKQERTTDAHLSLKIAGGNDTNPLLLEDIYTLPGETKDSRFVKSSLSAQIPTGAKGLGVELYSHYTRHMSKFAQDYDNVIGFLALDYQWNNRFSTYVAEDAVWYKIDGKMKILSATKTLGLRGIPLKGETWGLDVNIPLSYLKYPNPKNRNPEYKGDGFITGVSMGLQHILWTFKLRESGGYSQQFASGRNLQMQSFEGGLAISRSLFFDWLVPDFSVFFSRASYPKTLPRRVELLVSSNFNLNILIPKLNTTLNASSTYMRSYSTITQGNYTKYVLSFGVTYDAF